MSAVDTILITVAFLHGIVGVFNFGAVVAYLTRRRVEHKLSFLRILYVYTVATVGFALGSLTIPSNFSSVEWPTYGWKIWWGEWPNSNCKWWQKKKMLARERDHEEFKARMRREAGTSGVCRSIWS